MSYINPDLIWYTKNSAQKGVSPRCPYANVHRCYRYYSSLYMMGDCRISTKMNEEKILELEKHWKESDLVPVVAEHHVGVSGSSDRYSNFTNFCPEITYDIFGLFAEDLHRYIDEIDKDVVHSRLSHEAYNQDWRWEWSSVKVMHFVDCSVYSQLSLSSKKNRVEDDSVNNKDGIFTGKFTLYGISLNFNNLFRKFTSKKTSNKTHQD